VERTWHPSKRTVQTRTQIQDSPADPFTRSTEIDELEGPDLPSCGPSFRGDVYFEFEPFLSLSREIFLNVCYGYFVPSGGKGRQTRVCWQQFELGGVEVREKQSL